MALRSPIRSPIKSAIRLATGEGGEAGGGGPAPSLGIRAAVGTSTSPTSTGLKAVTGVGFQPKVVMPFGSLQSSTGSANDALLGFGSLASSSQAAISVSSLNGLTTSNTDRRHANDRGVSQITDGTVTEGASRSSLDADGFTLNWNTAAAAANILNHICLGGADLEVSLTQHQMNNTNAPQSFAHGLSGAPTGLLAFSAINASVPPNTSAFNLLSVGMLAGSSQLSASVRSDSGMTTARTGRVLRSDSLIHWPSLSPIRTDRTMAVGSVDATNVNCTYPVTNVTDAVYFWLLAIRGAKCQVGTFDCNGSTSPLTINCTGIAPKLFLPIFIPLGVDNIGTVQNDLMMSIGASDGTNNVSCGITDANGVTTTNARRYQSSTTLAEYNTAGTKVFEGTAAFSGESVVLTPTTNSSATYGQGSYLIIGS